jgi:hypothetical protein
MNFLVPQHFFKNWAVISFWKRTASIGMHTFSYKDDLIGTQYACYKLNALTIESSFTATYSPNVIQCLRYICISVASCTLVLSLYCISELNNYGCKQSHATHILGYTDCSPVGLRNCGCRM